MQLKDARKGSIFIFFYKKTICKNIIYCKLQGLKPFLLFLLHFNSFKMQSMSNTFILLHVVLIVINNEWNH